MDQLDHLASAHEALILLVRTLPREKLLRLLCTSAGIELVELSEFEELTPTTEIPSVLRRARLGLPDLVLVVRTAGRVIVMLWVIEAQLCWDYRKEYDWALFPVAFAAEVRKRALLAVFVPDPLLRARYRRTMLPKIQPRPILIERDQIELIADTAEARRRPQEAVLGATFHAREPDQIERRVAGIRAAFVAIQSLDSRERRSYTVLMLSIAPPGIAQRALAEAHEHGELDEDRQAEISEIERTGYLFHVGHEVGRQEGHEAGRQEGHDAGRQEGHEAGRQEGHEAGRQEGHEAGRQEGHEAGARSGQIQVLRRALIDVLELRGFVVTADHRAQIHACDELTILERGYAKARTLAKTASLEQLFD
jgi:flagellar biosynthesis/type III secretory pathway protein FliH